MLARPALALEIVLVAATVPVNDGTLTPMLISRQ